jgi:hypothetical protein
MIRGVADWLGDFQHGNGSTPAGEGFRRGWKIKMYAMIPGL